MFSKGWFLSFYVKLRERLQWPLSDAEFKRLFPLSQQAGLTIKQGDPPASFRPSSGAGQADLLPRSFSVRRRRERLKQAPERFLCRSNVSSPGSLSKRRPPVRSNRTFPTAITKQRGTRRLTSFREWRQESYRLSSLYLKCLSNECREYQGLAKGLSRPCKVQVCPCFALTAGALFYHGDYQPF